MYCFLWGKAYAALMFTKKGSFPDKQDTFNNKLYWKHNPTLHFMDGVVSLCYGDAPVVDRKNEISFDFPPNQKITGVFEKQVP